MKHADNIERLIKNETIKTSPAVNEAVFNDLADKLDKAQSAQANTNQPNIWSTIMKSKKTQLALAAVIIIAAMIGINHFGGSVDITSVAFADVISAMKDIKWMHQNSKGFENGINGTGEQWVGFDAKIHAGKWADGKVTFWNVKEHKKYTYDPEKNTITVDYAPENELPWGTSSPTTLLEGMYDAFIKQGAEIVTKQADYKGHKVIAMDISLQMNVGDKTINQSLILNIEPDTKHLINAVIKGEDSEGNILMDGKVEFSYPQNGPENIYDLGVPRDAKIINNVPDAQK